MAVFTKEMCQKKLNTWLAAEEETAQMTGGDYNRNIKLRVTEAKRKREVDEIGKAQTAGE